MDEHVKGWLLLVVGVPLLVVASAACGSSSQTSAALAGPDPYDVAAARACHALDVFVKDAKSNHPSRADGNALDDAQKKLNARWGGRLKWATLSEDLTALVNDAAIGDANGAVQSGKSAGQECSRIPAPAQRAGGFTN